MKVEPQPDGTVHVELDTGDLSEIVAEWVAKYARVQLPVHRSCMWSWKAGTGPELDIVVRPVPNVARLDSARTRPTVRTGRRPA